MIGLWEIIKEGETLVTLRAVRRSGELKYSEKKMRISWGPLTQGLILHYYPFWDDK